MLKVETTSRAQVRTFPVDPCPFASHKPPRREPRLRGMTAAVDTTGAQSGIANERKLNPLETLIKAGVVMDA